MMGLGQEDARHTWPRYGPVRSFPRSDQIPIRCWGIIVSAASGSTHVRRTRLCGQPVVHTVCNIAVVCT